MNPRDLRQWTGGSVHEDPTSIRPTCSLSSNPHIIDRPSVWDLGTE
jgi:hypothetical protein